jgi:hypothetical protein
MMSEMKGPAISKTLLSSQGNLLIDVVFPIAFQYWQWMRSENSTTADWLWKRRPIPGQAQLPSSWIRSNGTRVVKKLSRIAMAEITNFAGGCASRFSDALDRMPLIPDAASLLTAFGEI